MKHVDAANFPGYRVNEEGSIESCWRWRGDGYGRKCFWYQSHQWKVLKSDIDKRGRARIRLRNPSGGYKKKFVHVLVLESFVGPRPKRHQACHNDGNCKNNKLSNLRWGTVVSNHNDKNKHGTMPNGETHPKAKLTELNVIEILQRSDQGESSTVLAREFGVSSANISSIIYGKTWTHVKGPRRHE